MLSPIPIPRTHGRDIFSYEFILTWVSETGKSSRNQRLSENLPLKIVIKFVVNVVFRVLSKNNHCMASKIRVI